jgi:hypothetical protein
MRKAIVMMLLAVVSSSAAAEWTRIGITQFGDHNSATVYADFATIRKARGMAKMWFLSDLEKAKVLDKDASYLSMRSHEEVDCQGERARTLVLSLHSGHMAGGYTVHTNFDIDKWRPVAPGTISETQWKAACGKR